MTQLTELALHRTIERAENQERRTTTMLSDEFLKGFRSAVSAYAMNTPRGAYDARFRRFTPRARATDQFEEELTNKSDDDRPLPKELMELLHAQLTPDTFQMLTDALNGTANDQDSDEEEDKPAAGLSPELIDRICEFVGPHLSDDAFEEFQQLLGGMSSISANDEPPPISGRPTPGGGPGPQHPGIKGSILRRLEVTRNGCKCTADQIADTGRTVDL